MIVIKERNGYINYKGTGEFLWQFRYQHTGPIMILDLDGTLRDDTQRLSLLPSKEELKLFPDNPNDAYKEYQAQSHKDSPIVGVVNIVKLIQSNHDVATIVLSTGTGYRSLGSCEVVVDQLKCWSIDYDVIIMRNEYDHRHSSEQKISCIELFKFTENDFRDRIFAIDDADHICNYFRDHGITTLQCERPRG